MSFNPDSAVMLSCSVIKLYSLSFLSNDDMYNNVYQKRQIMIMVNDNICS